MPLIKSASKSAVSANIRAERAAGKPQKQAIAIALDVARRARRKAEGGAAEDEGQMKKSGGGVAMSNARRYANGGKATTTFITKDDNIPGGVGTITYPGRAGWYGGSPETNPNLRPTKKAGGGSTRVPGPSFFQRDANRALSRNSGLIKSVVPGRTDKHAMRVASGSYIIPADVVSHLGQNNTLAGAKFLKRKFGGGGTVQFADGGSVDMPVDIIAAGGEYVLSPEQVASVGRGDMKAGHDKLDRLVLDTRKHHIKTLRNLKPPKRS